MMWGVWLLLITVAPTDAAGRRLRWFVSFAMLLTLIGYGLVWFGTWNPDAAAGLLRFYWFRTSDVFIPLGVSLAGLAFVVQLGSAENGGADVAFRGAKERVFFRGAKDDNGPLVRRLWLAGLIAISSYDLYRQTVALAAEPDSIRISPPSCRGPTRTSPMTIGSMPAAGSSRTPIRRPAFSRPAWRRRSVGMPTGPRSSVGRTFRKTPRGSSNGGTGCSTSTRSSKRRRPNGSIRSGRSAPRINELGKKYDAQYAIVQLSPDVPPLPAKAEFENASYAVYRLPMKLQESPK